MKKGIGFIICFFLTFNFALMAGIYSRKDKNQSAKEKYYDNSSIMEIANKSRTQEAFVDVPVSDKNPQSETVVPTIQTVLKTESLKINNPEKQKDETLKVSMPLENSCAIHQSAADYEKLYKKWNKPREVLGSLTNIIKTYSETKGFEASSKQLFVDMSAYSKKLNAEVIDLATKEGAKNQKASYQESQKSLKENKIFLNPFNARRMYMDFLKSYYGTLQNQHVFMHSVNQNRVADPNADNFIVDGNKVVAENKTYQELKNITDNILKLFSQGVEE